MEAQIPIGIFALFIFRNLHGPHLLILEPNAGRCPQRGGLKTRVTKTEIPALLPLVFWGVVVVAWKTGGPGLLLCASPRASAS
ncbi:hypothetical protein TNIN_136101 [Trichonephila inaurata madagascariensis]|uniref:Uncharacterized protein n=1 Tax=Trichonephila inaurata madagascariensis TaxID=2747483 RepID=A0A8X6WXP2_9ARAC|nr:hypothetical protein TNIN_136101 [Trichonephila inaurata madagascariensis]